MLIGCFAIDFKANIFSLFSSSRMPKTLFNSTLRLKGVPEYVAADVFKDVCCRSSKVSPDFTPSPQLTLGLDSSLTIV